MLRSSRLQLFWRFSLLTPSPAHADSRCSLPPPSPPCQVQPICANTHLQPATIEALFWVGSLLILSRTVIWTWTAAMQRPTAPHLKCTPVQAAHDAFFFFSFNRGLNNDLIGQDKDVSLHCRVSTLLPRERGHNRLPSLYLGRRVNRTTSCVSPTGAARPET